MTKTYRLRKTNQYNYWAIQADGIRRTWSAQCPIRKQCIRNALVKIDGVYKARCNHCPGFFARGYYAVDHIIPIGMSYPTTEEKFYIFCKRTLVKLEGLQILCNTCHTSKTNRESESRRMLK